MKHTPLHDVHEALGARMIDFAGWHMPVLYSSIPEEVAAVRTAVGLFDLTHMGRLVVSGPERDEAVQRLVSNDIARIRPGAIRYALLCDADGRVLDDTLVYHDADSEQWHIVVNAANRDADFAHARAVAGDFEATVANVSDDQTMLALQGPRSADVLAPLTSLDVGSIGYYRFTWGEVADVFSLVSRTGYTGEDGFELFFPRAESDRIWNALAESGAGHGLRPIGLGARDVLRTEAGMPLYGQEIEPTTNPFAAGLGWGVRLDSGFLGAEAIQAGLDAGLPEKLVGLVASKGRVPRPGCAVLAGGEAIGRVTSGTFSPTLDRSIAMAYVANDFAAPGGTVQIDVRGKPLDAEVVDLPFYRRPRPDLVGK